MRRRWRRRGDVAVRSGGSSACASSGASAASGGCVIASNLTLVLDTASIQNTGSCDRQGDRHRDRRRRVRRLTGIPVSFTRRQRRDVHPVLGHDRGRRHQRRDGLDRRRSVQSAHHRHGDERLADRRPRRSRSPARFSRRPARPSWRRAAPTTRSIFRLTNANGAGIANQPISIVAGALGTTSADHRRQRQLHLRLYGAGSRRVARHRRHGRRCLEDSHRARAVGAGRIAACGR